MGLLDDIKDKVSDAADAVADAVGEGVFSAVCKMTEIEIKNNTDKDIEVEVEDCPDDWKDWMMKTGMNSLCCDRTWDFLEKSEYNQRKIDNWNERNIKKIILTVKKEPEEHTDWIVCWGEWENDSTTLKLAFYPRAKRWSSSRTWNEPGAKCWWILRDEIVFTLQLFQLPGRCFYKSDYLDGVEDPDPDSPLPFGSKKFKRWFQFRHWVIFWYGRARWGWNYQWTKNPPPNPDGSLFSLDSVLSMPELPDLKMPSITLPSLPDVEMPSLPDMPSVDLPSISAPSLSAPSLSAPDMSNMSAPSIPDKPQRPTNVWACHGLIELNGLKVKAKGDKLVFSNATITHFWQDGPHHIKDEKKDRQRMELETTSEEQSQSWVESLKESGVEEGEDGGCCTIA